MQVAKYVRAFAAHSQQPELFIALKAAAFILLLYFFYRIIIFRLDFDLLMSRLRYVGCDFNHIIFFLGFEATWTQPVWWLSSIEAFALYT